MFLQATQNWGTSVLLALGASLVSEDGRMAVVFIQLDSVYQRLYYPIEEASEKENDTGAIVIGRGLCHYLLQEG